MSEPEKQIETDFLRLIVESFDLCTTIAARHIANSLGLDLIDLHDALLSCVANWSNKLDADGAYFCATGMTESGLEITMSVWVDSNFRVCRVEHIQLASGELGDVETMQNIKAEKAGS